jgi:type IV pilus assembly protein PilV
VNTAITIGGTGYSWANAPAFVAAGSPDCTKSATPCTPVQLAAYDLQQWAIAVNNVLPNAAVLIRCGTVTPVSCMLTISWAEKAVAANAQEAVAAQNSAMQIPTYTLYIEP